MGWKTSASSQHLESENRPKSFLETQLPMPAQHQLYCELFENSASSELAHREDISASLAQGQWRH